MRLQCPLPPQRIAVQRTAGAFELRRAEVGDAQAVVEAVHDSLPELRAFMPWAHDDEGIGEAAQARRIAQARKSWDARTDFLWHLYTPRGRTERLVGCIGLHNRNLNPLALEVGYWIRSDAAGHGLCTAAVQALVIVAFDHMRLDRLQVGCDSANAGSRRVIEKVGFRFEGTLPGSLPRHPLVGPRDTWQGTGNQRLYALLPTSLDALPWLNPARSCVTCLTPPK